MTEQNNRLQDRYKEGWIASQIFHLNSSLFTRGYKKTKLNATMDANQERNKHNKNPNKHSPAAASTARYYILKNKHLNNKQMGYLNF